MSERKNLIAVYGTLRNGCGNHAYLLGDAEFMGSFVSEPVFKLFNLGGFPGLKNGGATAVHMEVYAVNDDEARAVDGLEGYREGREPHFYDKQPIETPFGTAGVYIYVRPTDDRNLIASGDWVNRDKQIENVRMV